MTKTADLFIFGKLDGIYQSVKLTPLKKITADEVEFYSGDEKMDMDVSLWKFMKDRDILVAGKKLRMTIAEINKRALLWQGSSERTADGLFNALADFSKKSKINFLVNYHSAEEEEIHGEKKPVLTFHPEVIIDGKRLINDFPDIDLNRRYIVLEGWKLLDITYSKSDSLPAPERFKDVVQKICEKTLVSLDDYFNVDYRVSLLFGTAKSEYTGLVPDVRQALIKAF